MTILAGVIEFFKSIPAIVSMLLELRKLFIQQLAMMDRRQKMKELKDAIEIARKEKNTEGIERVLSSIVNSR